MKTESLIRALAVDGARPAMPISRSLLKSGAIGIVLSGLLFVATLHPRVDLRDALFTFAFSFKLIVALALVVTTAPVLADVARPVPGLRRYRRLLLAPALLAIAVAAELSLMPGRFWLQRLMGHDASHCLALIPMLSLTPASCLLIALRHGAPRRPAVAGAILHMMSNAAREPRLDPREPELDENGVDLSQIRAMLALTPAERLQRVTEFMNSLLAIRARNGGTGSA